MTASALHAQQLGPAFIELVVARARKVQAKSAQGEHGRFVVEQRREQRRPADVVAGRHDHGVGVGRLQSRDVRGKILDATHRDLADAAVRAHRGLQVAVEVVEREDLHLDERWRRLGQLRPAGLRTAGERDTREEGGGPLQGSAQRHGSTIT